MSKPFKVDELLSEVEYRDYETFLKSRPAPTVDECFAWIIERGYKVGRTAVWKHKKDFEQTLNDVRQASEMAKAFTSVAKESGVTGMNDAIMAKFQQLQMQWAFGQLNGGDLPPEDMERFAKSMNQAASAAQRNQDLRERFDEAMKAIQTKSEKKGGAISAEDIAEVRKAVFG